QQVVTQCVSNHKYTHWVTKSQEHPSLFIHHIALENFHFDIASIGGSKKVGLAHEDVKQYQGNH
ncbi:MAG TPA: hypothetical protein VEH81_10130, partial [Ktedonobacteraceae bacterium]|nr:hypothetical protein [Ktedonobacteraceae bacterium]